MNRASVETLRAKLLLDRANAAATLQQLEGAIAACNHLLADDDKALAEAAEKSADAPQEPACS